ncbi:MAG TPA: hypothetical protein VG318_17985 [Actinomycetota bacterium]|nr:hypothetical protein [Actinomycetota bacterium]
MSGRIYVHARRFLSFFSDLWGFLGLVVVLAGLFVQAARGFARARPAVFSALLILAVVCIGLWIVNLGVFTVRRRRLEKKVRASVPKDLFSRPFLPAPSEEVDSALEDSGALIADFRDRELPRAILAGGALFVGLLAGIGALLIGPSQDRRETAGTPAATIVLLETFDGLNGQWSTTRFTTTDSGRRFLGRFSADTVDLTVDDLPRHRSVQISFDLFIVGSWDGVARGPGLGPDRFQVRADGPDPIFDAAFTNLAPDSITRQSYPLQYGAGECPGESGGSEADTLGYLFRGTVRDSVYRITTNVDHVASSVRVRFTGFGLTTPSSEPLSDESWGLDNVMITTSTQPEPNPVPRWATSCES